MKDRQKSEEIATFRLELLSPLLEKGLDPAKAAQIKAQICTETGLSERTIRRYLNAYREAGFEGLKPKGKARAATSIPEELLEQAVLLRREVPSRSVAQIIEILEWEGLSPPGSIKRSTLQEKLAQKGYSTRQMKTYATVDGASRRYQKTRRNSLWHSDLKFGPYLPIGKNGQKKRTYMVAFLDDATRFCLHAEFYPLMDQVIVEDAFRKAIAGYGVPEKVFFDNGGQYKNVWMSRACAKMGIRLLYARPYSPESRGKSERFNRAVTSFLNEAQLEQPQSVEELNRLFSVWLEECYQRKPHSALKDNVSPETAFRLDKEPLRFLNPQIIAEAFLHSEERRVDKTGCISFQGAKYEVGLLYVGLRVEVIYDPTDPSELRIECEGYPSCTAKRQVITERTAPRPELPEHISNHKPQGSRLLTAAAKKNAEREPRLRPAVIYSRTGGEDDA